MFGSEAICAAILVLQAGVHPVQVPTRLAALTSNPELSGIVWSPQLQRYIVVSDDTGMEGQGTRHSPWAFTLSPSGSLDADPLPINGIAILNDAESICQGPAGAFFITTSHSLNTSGNLPAARRQLMLVEVRGRRLQVVGNVDLTQARAADGSGLLALAGLDASRPLDIEALTFRNDDLYIGLKSPLTSAGEATILRLARAASVVRSGTIPSGAVTRSHQLQMCVQASTGKVCQGISDLTFLQDGSLVLVGNAPKGGPTDSGGALWRLANPSGPDRVPRMVRKFTGLKPEGVTLTSDGQAIVVVFDRDRQTPGWMRCPLPL